MKKTRTYCSGNLIMLVVFVMFLILVVAAVFGLRILGGCGVTFSERFRLVQPGASHAKVVRLLGPPDERSTAFHLGQEQGYEDQYKLAHQSNSKYYLFWNRGIDVVYAVGFDDGSNVTMKALGGT